MDKLKKEREQKDKKKNKATTKPIAKPIWWRDKKDEGMHGMVKKTERYKEIWDENNKKRKTGRKQARRGIIRKEGCGNGRWDDVDRAP